MGNWGKRSRFRRQRSPLRWYSERHSSSSGYGEEDGIPAWEKRFCEVIGSVPWQKVKEASYFKSWYQGNVITWNDSACEETFHNVKRRFWSQVNGLPCDNYLPDPDLYNSEVNWDTVIDPELIMDIEQAYFAPPEDAKLGFNKNLNAVSVEESHEETPMLENQWKSSEIVHELGKESDAWNLSKSGTEYSKDRLSFGNEKANIKTSGHQNKRAKCSEVVLPKECSNPWEAELSCRTETAQDVGWGGSSRNGWDDKGWDNNCRGNSEWRNHDLGNQFTNMERRNTSYSRGGLEHKGYSPWKVGYKPNNGASFGSNETKQQRNWEVKRWSNGCIGRNNQREDMSRYNTNYKNSRSRRNDGQYVNARAGR